MTEGTSQGLFVGLSYTIFGEILSPKMVNLFETAVEGLPESLGGIKKPVPITEESEFDYLGTTSIKIIGYK